MIALNRAVAIAMAEGPELGLGEVERLAPDLESYYLYRATRADLLRRLGLRGDAAQSYERALALATSPVERAFLECRLGEMGLPAVS